MYIAAPPPFFFFFFFLACPPFFFFFSFFFLACSLSPIIIVQRIFYKLQAKYETNMKNNQFFTKQSDSCPETMKMKRREDRTVVSGQHCLGALRRSVCLTPETKRRCGTDESCEHIDAKNKY